MEDLRTFYDVLEIPETASAAEAAAAYKRMVKEYHPDRLVGLPGHLTKLRKDAEEKWQEIQDAWDVLGDPAKRAQYDEALRQLREQADPAPSSAPPPPGGPGPSSPSPSASPHSSQSQYSQYTPPPPPPPPSWSAAPPSSPPPGGPPPGTQSAPQPPSSLPVTTQKTGLSRGWAIALGWIVFGVVLFFGEAFQSQNVARQSPQPPGWVAGASFYSLFGMAIFVGVAVTGLLQAKRRRAVVSGIMGAASGGVFIVLLGVSAAVPTLQKAALGDPQRAIPESLNRIYAALDDGRVSEAAPLLSADLLKNAQYLCRPFTHRAHYASSIVALNDGSYLARERVLFKPFTEKAYLLWFRPAAGAYVLVAARDDPFTGEITAARETVRQFIFAGRGGQWDAVARYASPHLPVETLKEDAWQTYFAGMTKTEIDYVEVKSERGLNVQLNVTVRGAGIWAPEFLVDLSTGKIVRAYYVRPNGMFTATSGAPTREGITDPDIEHDTLARFGLLNNAQSTQSSATSQTTGASTAIEEARRIIPSVLDRIYAALNDAKPQEASPLLPPAIINSEHDLDYLCQPFTHRAHYVVSVVEQPDGTYLARVRTLFKPFKERAFVFHFRKTADSYVAFRIDDDSFAQEGDAAKDTVRQFILAAKAGDWDRVAQYTSPHFPVDGLKTTAWERYLSRIGGTDPEGSMRINTEHGILIEQQFVLRLLEDPGFLIDPATGKIVRAFYKVGTSFTNAASPPDYAGITDPDIDNYAQRRFGLLPDKQ